VLHPPEWLEAPVAATRLVVIGQHIPHHWPLRLLAAIEEEVLAASALPVANGGR
jgi:hypothetical protein